VPRWSDEELLIQWVGMVSPLILRRRASRRGHGESGPTDARGPRRPRCHWSLGTRSALGVHDARSRGGPVAMTAGSRVAARVTVA